MGIIVASIRLLFFMPILLLPFMMVLSFLIVILIISHVDRSINIGSSDILLLSIFLFIFLQYVSFWMLHAIPSNLDFPIRTDPVRHIRWTRNIMFNETAATYPYPPVVHTIMALIYSLGVPLVFALRLASLLFIMLYLASTYSAYTFMFRSKVGALSAALISAFATAAPLYHFRQDTIANLLADTMALNLLPIALAFISDGDKRCLLLAAPLVAALPATHVTYIIIYVTLFLHAALESLLTRETSYLKRTLMLLAFTALSLHITHPWIIQTTIGSKKYITGSAFVIPPPRNAIELFIYEKCKTLYVFLRFYGPVPLILAITAVTAALSHAQKASQLRAVITWWLILAAIATIAKVLPHGSTQGEYNITIFPEKSIISAKGRAVLCSITPSNLLIGQLLNSLYTSTKVKWRKQGNILLGAALLTIAFAGNFPPTPHTPPISQIKKAIKVYKREKMLLEWIQENIPNEKILRVVTLNYTIIERGNYTKTTFETENFISLTEALLPEKRAPNITYLTTIETAKEVVINAITENYTYIIINARAYNAEEYLANPNIKVLTQIEDHIILKIAAKNEKSEVTVEQ